MMEISTTIKVPRIVSVNSMYIPHLINTNYGQKFVGLILSDEARYLKECIHEELGKQKLNEKMGEIDWDYPFELTICYLINSNILKRDLNNFHKCVIDGIFEYFDLNDSRIFSEHYHKIEYDSGDWNSEYIKIILRQSKYRYDEMKLC